MNLAHNSQRVVQFTVYIRNVLTTKPHPVPINIPYVKYSTVTVVTYDDEAKPIAAIVAPIKAVNRGPIRAINFPPKNPLPFNIAKAIERIHEVDVRSPPNDVSFKSALKITPMASIIPLLKNKHKKPQKTTNPPREYKVSGATGGGKRIKRYKREYHGGDDNEAGVDTDEDAEESILDIIDQRRVWKR